MFIGNQHLIRDFKKLAQNNSLAHGYVFFGEPQVGKFGFALSLANYLETGNFDFTSKILSETLVIKEIGIDSVREIKSFLWQKPQNAPKRTVIIDNADLLTQEAQGAILKITEEPPEHSLIILVVSNLNNVLPPILSRLQKIYFSRVSSEEIKNLLIDNLNIKTERATEITKLAYGRPGRAINLLNNKIYAEAEELVGKFLRLSDFNKSQFIKQFVEDQKEKPELLDLFFENLIVVLRRDPVKNSPIIKSVLGRLFLIKSYNVNKRLQIEAIIN